MAEWEDTIAERIHRGDSTAFDELFDRYGPRLLAYLQGMTRDPCLAEDLLQETFVRVHQHIHRYEERGAFKAWVYRTATNVALTELRRRRYATSVPLDEEALHVEEPGADPARRLETGLRLAAVDEALSQLGEEHRVVILLRVREEMGMREIAETLRVPVGTVKSRMHHAVRYLREWIETQQRHTAAKESPDEL